MPTILSSPRLSVGLGVVAMALVIMLILAMVHYFGKTFKPCYLPETVCIVQNHARPNQARELVNHLARLPSVRLVLLVHSSSATRFVVTSPKVRVTTESDPAYGPANRFIAINELADLDDATPVVFLDDDMMPSKELMGSLQTAVRTNPRGLYGPCGARCTRSGYRGHRWFRANNNVILTKIMATSLGHVRGYMRDFWEVAEPTLRANRGNCEDLSINVYTRRVGGPILRVSGFYRDGGHDINAISAGSQHMQMRGDFCRAFHP